MNQALGNGMNKGQEMGDLLIQRNGETEKPKEIDKENEAATVSITEEKKEAVALSGSHAPTLEDYRSSVYLSGLMACRKCNVYFTMPEDHYAHMSPEGPNWFPLCRRCYGNLYFRTSQQGRKIYAEYIKQQVPPVYSEAEFNTLDCSGPYGAHLHSVLQKVVVWAKDFLAGSKGSLYLFSTRGKHGSGCGNGKTHLLWSAYKYLARSTAGVRDECGPVPRTACQYLDPECLVNDFKRRKARCDEGELPAYEIPCKDGGFRREPFDIYRKYLASRSLMFIDDIGKSVPLGMLRETIEYLVDFRASYGLPTFYTSNFSIDDLDRRLGPRIASRIVRNGCTVVEVKAPDFCRCRVMGAPQIVAPANTGSVSPEANNVAPLAPARKEDAV